MHYGDKTASLEEAQTTWNGPLSQVQTMTVTLTMVPTIDLSELQTEGRNAQTADIDVAATEDMCREYESAGESETEYERGSGGEYSAEC
jgi:hypothetical protein